MTAASSGRTSDAQVVLAALTFFGAYVYLAAGMTLRRCGPEN
jgi:hypothetical protein